MATMASTLARCSSAPSQQPSFYFDDKWKFSRKESSSRSRSSTSSFMIRNPSSSSNSSSNKRCAFTRKCARLVKEQRARFYIMRRCVTMLICWHDYSDS